MAWTHALRPKGVKQMNGYELLVPYVVADKLERFEAERLARQAQKQARAHRAVDEIEAEGLDFPHEPWVPVLLRGYPYDPEYSR